MAMADGLAALGGGSLAEEDQHGAWAICHRAMHVASLIRCALSARRRTVWWTRCYTSYAGMAEAQLILDTPYDPLSSGLPTAIPNMIL
jgi:hypothetical protein